MVQLRLSAEAERGPTSEGLEFHRMTPSLSETFDHLPQETKDELRRLTLTAIQAALPDVRERVKRMTRDARLLKQTERQARFDQVSKIRTEVEETRADMLRLFSHLRLAQVIGMLDDPQTVGTIKVPNLDSDLVLSSTALLALIDISPDAKNDDPSRWDFSNAVRAHLEALNRLERYLDTASASLSRSAT